MNWKNILKFKSIGVVLVLALTVTIPVRYVAAAEMVSDSYFQSEGYRYIPGLYIDDPIRTDAGFVSGSKIDAVSAPGLSKLVTELFGPPVLPGKVGDIGRVVRIYRGIPYAAPPVGDLRWKPPQPVTPWQGIRECTVFSPMAPQASPSAALYGSITESGMSEDCLYLNVLTPALKKNERLPVMVWFHGGGLYVGSSNPVTANCPPLPQHDVVLVTVQHRIGPIGYMAHPALTAESSQHVSGNYGYLDLIAALKWVKKNIDSFGGDPNRVTIFGESGGGNKTDMMMASPLAKGLFHRVICQSGVLSTFNGTPLAATEQLGMTLAAKLGVTGTGPEALVALRAKTWQEIIKAATATNSGYSDLPTVDGWFLPDTLTNLFSTGRQNDVPYLVGINGGDMPLIFTSTVAFVPNIKQSSNVYAYLFNHVPDGWRAQGVLDAYHGLDVVYVYGVQKWVAGLYWTLFYPPRDKVSPDPGINENDDFVAEAMMSMWAQFAETGDPNVRGLVKWPTYNSKSDQYLYIDYPLEVRSGFSTLVERMTNHWGL